MLRGKRAMGALRYVEPMARKPKRQTAAQADR